MRRRNFLLGAAGIAAAGVGGIAWRLSDRNDWKKARGGVDHSEYEGPYSRLSELPPNASFDVCVIGSGPAGTFLASDLAERGVRVLLIEAGLAPTVMSKDPRYANLNGYRRKGTIDYPLSATHLMAPGGTSALWNGRCPRLSVRDFEQHAYTPAGSAWPIGYSDLEPYYARAEQSLRVAGEPQPQKHCPRSTPIEPPARALPSDAPIRELARRAGLDNSEIFLPPTSISPTGLGPVRVARDVLADVAKKQSLTLVLGATAHRFLDDESGRIVEMTARDIDGTEKAIHARAFVLAGGAVETARRLLLCRSERWPEGLGNRHGRVGLSFSDHTGLHFSGFLDLPRSRVDGAYQRARSFQFYDPLKEQGLGSMMLHLGVRPVDEEGDSTRHVFEMITELELEFSDSNRIALSTDAGAVDPFGDPHPDHVFGFSERDLALHARVRETINGIYSKVRATKVEERPVAGWGHHHMGTVRMGSDPKTSVVDADLRVHGLKNLYTATSGTYVTSGAVNPTLTIVALSHRLADHLLEGLQSDLPPVSV